MDFIEFLASSAFAKGYPWSRQHVKDLASIYYMYEPFIIWRPGFLETETINIGPAGDRATWTPASLSATEPESRSLYFFGGSTGFGVCARDDETIPSYLAKALDRDGHSVTVKNWSVEGHNLAQCFISFIQRLRRGEKPSVAVFYSGVNEFTGGVIDPGVPEAHGMFMRTKYLFEDGHSKETPGSVWHKIDSFQKQFPGAAFTYDNLTQKYAAVDFSIEAVKQRCRAAFETYKKTIDLIRGLALANGIQPIFIWQPCLLFGDKPLSPHEIFVRRTGDIAFPLPERCQAFLAGVPFLWELAEKSETASGFHFLGRVVEEMTEHAYWDWNHVGPSGNQVIGERIAAIIREAKVW